MTPPPDRRILMADQFMPAVYSLIEAVADGKIAEGECDWRHDTDEVEIVVSVVVRSEIRHIRVQDHPTDGR